MSQKNTVQFERQGYFVADRKDRVADNRCLIGP